MSKHTKGPVRVASEETVTVRDKTDVYICSFGWLKGPHGLGGRRSVAEVIANAYLTADALRIHHETGLTPRQIADQRAELLQALKSICEMQQRNYGDGISTHIELKAMADELRAIIANAEGQGL